MKKTVIGCLAIIILLMLTAPAHAQIYKYTDENGQKRWTDDLSQVPVDQRETAEHFEPVEDVTQAVSAGPEDGEAGDAASPPQSDDNGAVTRDSLAKERSELEKQYQYLVEERKQLEQMKSETTDAAQRTALNERISAYNAKSREYDKQLSAYNAKIEALNKKTVNKNDAQAQ